MSWGRPQNVSYQSCCAPEHHSFISATSYTNYLAMIAPREARLRQPLPVHSTVGFVTVGKRLGIRIHAGREDSQTSLL